MGYLLAVILIFGLAGLAVILYLSRKVPVVVVILTIPVVLLGLLINCRHSEIEMAINFFFPPDDLGSMNVSMPLSETSTVYSASLQHKYPGRYSVWIWISSPKRPDNEDKKTILDIHCKVFEGNEIIHEKNYVTGTPLWGSDGGIFKVYGYSYWDYYVPKDLPRRVPLRFEISLLGDVAQFLKENNGAELVIDQRLDK